MAFGFSRNSKFEIAIYAQQCTGAGTRCGDPARRYGDDWRTSDDLMVFEGTEAELLAEAAELADPRRSGFQNRCAAVIRDYLGWKPEEAGDDEA
jgi:hypothetical protein